MNIKYKRIKIDFEGFSHDNVEYIYEMKLEDSNKSTSLYLTNEDYGDKQGNLYIMPFEILLKVKGNRCFKIEVLEESEEDISPYIKGALLSLAYMLKESEYENLRVDYIFEGELKTFTSETRQERYSANYEAEYRINLETFGILLDSSYKTLFNLTLKGAVNKVKYKGEDLYGNSEFFGKTVDSTLDTLWVEGEPNYIYMKFDSWGGLTAGEGTFE